LEPRLQVGTKKGGTRAPPFLIQLACGARLSQGTLYLDSVAGFKDWIRGLALIDLL
jgi:hypothetical protein